MLSNIITSMIAYYSSDVKRINHFMKVYSFAKAIGEAENIDKDTQEILEAVSIVHDIGIKVSEQKYNSSSENYQQIEGPPVAEKMLKELGYDDKFIERVCYLIAHHHIYNNIDGIDYQILVESDFLVNIYEDNIKIDEIKSIKEKIFKTKTGIYYLEKMFI